MNNNIDLSNFNLYPNFDLYLSKEGNNIEIKSLLINGNSIPEQEQASACKTHQQVLHFLEGLRTSTQKNHLNFYHYNNLYYCEHIGHWQGVIHRCPLDKQIDFVRSQIDEINNRTKCDQKVSCVFL